MNLCYLSVAYLMSWLKRLKHRVFPPPHKCGHFIYHDRAGIKECGGCGKKFWVCDNTPVYPPKRSRIRFK